MRRTIGAIAAITIAFLVVLSRGDFIVSQTPIYQTYFLGEDLAWTGSPVNGFGPPEVNRSNGESGAADGGTINIAGNTYAKGIGVHGVSTLTFTLPAPCTEFSAEVGVDNESINPNGVVFRVSVGGVQKRQTSPMYKKDGPRALEVHLKPADTTLVLSVIDVNSNLTGDHADWANAVVKCGGSSSGLTPTPTTPTPTPTATGTPVAPASFTITFGTPDSTYWPQYRTDNASWPEQFAYERVAGQFRVFMASPEWATTRLTGTTWAGLVQSPAHPTKVLDRATPGNPLVESPDGGYVAITTIYRSGSTLYGIYNAEYWNNPPTGGTCAADTFAASVMWAKSVDDGVTWTDRARLIGGNDPYDGATFCAASRLSWGADHGQLITDRGDGYFYITFYDWSDSAPDQSYIARILATDFTAGGGALASCRKYNAGVWTSLCIDPADTNQAGKGGPATCVLCRPLPEDGYYGTSNVTYNTYLGKYLAVSESDRDYDNGGSLWLQTSTDLLTWSAPQYIGHKRGDACSGNTGFYQLVSPDTSDTSRVTTQSGYMLYRCGAWGTWEPFTLNPGP